jgi:small subunit ribosomal protein S3
VDELRATLERLVGRRMRVNIVEIRMPEVEAALVARSVADQLERRVSHRRAMKQAVLRAMQRGALGIKIKVSGRLGGGEMSRKDKEMVGRVPLHTLRADIDYGTSEARTTLGRIGVKVWVYKGDIRFEREEPERPAEEEESSSAGPASSPEPAAAPTE